ncbi:MAG: hypothetical protein IKK14_03660 [Oscillospiraceae bacterium]|nr:hypothetical protein [Oscillospiraceae bacterium]
MRFKILLVLAVLAAVFSGCSAKEPENILWERNPSEHWINGKNGEKLNVGEHELDEESFCKICGCEIVYQVDGVITVSNYDEKGNPVRVTNFAFQGKSFDDYITEYKYDENGGILYSETFENGRLCETFEKTGETVQKDYYYIDGSHHLSITYPGYLGDTIISQWYSYDPEGNVEYEEYTENLLDKNGEIYLNRTTSIHYPTETKVVSEANALGHPLSVEKYDLDGNLIDNYDYAYEYGEENLIVYEKIIHQGKLYKEHFLKVITQGEGLVTQPCKEITYHETGHYVIEYDENGNITAETHYDSDGNIIE